MIGSVEMETNIKSVQIDTYMFEFESHLMLMNFTWNRRDGLDVRDVET